MQLAVRAFHGKHGRAGAAGPWRRQTPEARWGSEPVNYGDPRTATSTSSSSSRYERARRASRGHKCLARVVQSVVACAFFVLMVLLKAGCVRAPGKALTVFPGKSSGSVTLPCDGLLAVLAGELPPGSWLLGASVDGVLTGVRGLDGESPDGPACCSQAVRACARDMACQGKETQG